uniref:SDR family oxidoreductase n=1 Tax=Streptomyces asoensis TaxID=249586 RepID=UPI001C0EFD5C|nr:SDR family oxidoreductase [Streptomyces asoensis]
MSSESALNVPPGMVHYRATKIAQLGMARGLAESYPASGVLRSAHPNLLLGRFTEWEEVANLIAYLASPLSTTTNGAALRVDGGDIRNVT